jgi:hypothetical protein
MDACLNKQLKILKDLMTMETFVEHSLPVTVEELRGLEFNGKVPILHVVLPGSRICLDTRVSSSS